jgi:hypothetical protein
MNRDYECIVSSIKLPSSYLDTSLQSFSMIPAMHIHLVEHWLEAVAYSLSTSASGVMRHNTIPCNSSFAPPFRSVFQSRPMSYELVQLSDATVPQQRKGRRLSGRQIRWMLATVRVRRVSEPLAHLVKQTEVNSILAMHFMPMESPILALPVGRAVERGACEQCHLANN